jgi:hypothetical protein
MPRCASRLLDALNPRHSQPGSWITAGPNTESGGDEQTDAKGPEARGTHRCTRGDDAAGDAPAPAEPSEPGPAEERQGVPIPSK